MSTSQKKRPKTLWVCISIGHYEHTACETITGLCHAREGMPAGCCGWSKGCRPLKYILAPGQKKRKGGE
jgi:hypothetical protein